MEVRRHIGYLPENAPLYTEMRVTESLKFVARMHGLSGAKAKERIDWAVQACGLEPKYLSNIGTLSRGFRQRVGLAQAVLHDPDLLILDEPTSGLDPIQIIEIRKLIMEIGKTKTVFFSTHIMQEVEAVCSRALIINRGKLAADGAPSELKATLGKEQKVVARLRGPTALELETLVGAFDSVGAVSVQNLPSDNWVECNVRMSSSRVRRSGGGDQRAAVPPVQGKGLDDAGTQDRGAFDGGRVPQSDGTREAEVSLRLARH